MPVTTALGRWKQKDQKFGVTLGYKPSMWGAELHDALCKNKTSVLTIVSLLSSQASGKHVLGTPFTFQASRVTLTSARGYRVGEGERF